MNVAQGKYAVIREMLKASKVAGGFDVPRADAFLRQVPITDRILFAGEGSSRIFPGKHAILRALRLGLSQRFHTSTCYEAAELDLKGWTVFGASNSGRTKELIFLFEKLKTEGIPTVGITAAENTPLEKVADRTFILSCGSEKAVSASKVVIEQALFLDQVVHRIAGRTIAPHLPQLGRDAERVLSADIAPEIVEAGAKAKRIFIAGRNDGAAEELTIKAVEMTRKLSVFLEGTMALHGVEEVMEKEDLLLVLDPFEREEERFDRLLRRNLGVEIVAISDRKTLFPTVSIPHSEFFGSYLQLMAAWNFLVHIGLALENDLDKPARARKIGNEA
ncbi:MAG: SIS domain-containing protein [Pseudomonadota bacterium]